MMWYAAAMAGLTLTLWIASLLCLTLGGVVVVGQSAAVVWRPIASYLGRPARSFSLIPFVGGLAGAIGMVLLPVEGVWRWAFVPLCLDVTILVGVPWLLYLWGRGEFRSTK